MKLSVFCSVMLIWVPLFAQAGAYKCTQLDGSTSFQDTPCPADANQSAMTLHKASNDSPAPPKSTSLLTKQEKQEFAKLAANCSQAMNRWNALKAARAANSGNTNNDAELKAAEKRVDDECN